MQEQLPPFWWQGESMTETTPEDAKVIEAIKAAREKAGLSQRELSLMISKSHSLIQKMEGGKRPARVTELTAIAVATGIDPVKLYQTTLLPKKSKG
jgi:ribosome-binding protein aMBF1 (putative translation factor)